MVLWLCFLKSLFISAAVFKLFDIRITVLKITEDFKEFLFT